MASTARTTPELPTIANQLPEPIPHALISGVPTDIRLNIPQVLVSVSATVPSRPTEHNTRPSLMKHVDPTIVFWWASRTSATGSPNFPPDPSP
jgi:hypothetical protein